jgi:hypothetical protein
MVSIILALLLASGFSEADEPGKDCRIWHTLAEDHRVFYSGGRLLRMGIGLGAGAVMANTSVDEDIRIWYQDDVRSSRTDDFAGAAKIFGEGDYVIPLSVVAASTKWIFGEDSPFSVVGDWGARTARAYVLGGPLLLALQRVTGGSRPGDGQNASHWRAFNDDNGLSGHAFVGAVPFLTIARMQDNSVVRYSFYVLSGLTAWSRINDDAHFASQAALGWYLAWEATDAVSDAESEEGKLAIVPLIRSDGEFVVLSLTW